MLIVDLFAAKDFNPNHNINLAIDVDIEFLIGLLKSMLLQKVTVELLWLIQYMVAMQSMYFVCVFV